MDWRKGIWFRRKSGCSEHRLNYFRNQFDGWSTKICSLEKSIVFRFFSWVRVVGSREIPTSLHISTLAHIPALIKNFFFGKFSIINSYPQAINQYESKYSRISLHNFFLLKIPKPIHLVIPMTPSERRNGGNRGGNQQQSVHGCDVVNPKVHSFWNFSKVFEWWSR